MSLYRKAWLFTAWSVGLLCLSPLVPEGMFGYFVGLWLLHGGIALFAFACPVCGLSLYRSSQGIIATTQPWPRRSCGDCGRDHRSS